MKIYKTILCFEDGSSFNDLWIRGSDAESYFRPDHYKNVVHAEFWEIGPDESELRYEPLRCLGEWDKDGKLFYCKENWVTDNENWKYDWED